MERRLLPLGLALAILTLAVFLPVAEFGYFTYDDQLYTFGNPSVKGGLSREGVLWAFTSVGYAANWHPLTWLSLMLDAHLFGESPRAHHLVNLLLHVTAAVLLMLALHRMTAALWRPALVAALFALHPLHVESVVWIAERKDVLSAVCSMLVLLSYAGYAKRPGFVRYAGVAALFSLALLAKPMAVTLPLVFLLLDVWPLGRLGPVGRPSRRAATGLLLEKIPLLGLSAAASTMTVLAQAKGGLVAPLAGVSPFYRLANALVSAVSYLGCAIWPRGLVFFYPHPGRSLPLWKAAAAAVFLSAATAACVFWWRRRPYLATGWFWYLGMLVPVIGLVQVGAQGMADRYTYLPLGGIFILGAWLVDEATAGWKHRESALWAVCVALLAAAAVLARVQVGYWRDNAVLFARSLEVYPDNWVVHNDLGNVLNERGRYREAIDHFSRALEKRPNFPDIHHNLGVALASVGRVEEAAGHYREALRLNPRSLETLYNLGNLLAGAGRLEESAAAYRRVLDLSPGNDTAHNNLATVLLRNGRTEEALSHYRKAVSLNPANAEAHNNLGVVLFDMGRAEEAVGQYREALAARPGYVTAMANMARALLGQGRGEEAAGWYREILRTDPANAEARARLSEIPLRPTPGEARRP